MKNILEIIKIFDKIDIITRVQEHGYDKIFNLPNTEEIKTYVITLQHMSYSDLKAEKFKLTANLEKLY